MKSNPSLSRTQRLDLTIKLKRISSDPVLRAHLPTLEEVMDVVESRQDCELILEENPLHAIFQRTSLERRIYLTEKGYIGLGPQSADDGDEVWILGGAKVPFVLRKCQEGGYTLVGESYVHGIMTGEALADATTNLAPIDIH